MMKRCLPALSIVLLSCTSSQDSDSTARFNGDWQAIMQGTEPVQVIEQQRFDCAPFTEPFFLRVRDGSVAGYMQADENYSFRTHIDSSGRFRALMQTDIVYTYEEIQRTRQSAIVLVLEGTLPGRTFRGTGKFVVGDTALDAKGCSTSVQFVAT